MIETQAIPGDPILKECAPDPCAVVIFGARGDLTKRKLVPALFNVMDAGADFAVLGLSRAERTSEKFRGEMHEAVGQFSRRTPIDEKAWKRFAAGMEYISGTFEDPSAYAALSEKLVELDGRHNTGGNRIYYLATPPKFFPIILRQLNQAGLIHAPGDDSWSRVIIEKPFGRDLGSARELNGVVAEILDESQTYRIDHYLGKETVQNLLVFRFGNSIFEPLWNRKYIDHVEITAAESIDVQGRGRFYDPTGVLRDIVQNHLLQVLALVAMEPPVSFDADDIRNEKVQLFRSLRPIAGPDVAQNVVRAQYGGYLKEEGVAPDSRTPTYVAMKINVDNWRWQGVPFYLRAGKGLARRVTEVSVHFQPIPLCLFGTRQACQTADPNVLTLRIQPEEGISLRFVTKVPGDDLTVSNVRMDMSYAGAFHKPLSEAYERLLLDCMRGDATLFARRDGVEEAWKFVSPILQAWDADRSTPVPRYDQGATGPAEADQMLRRHGHAWMPLG